MSVQDVANLPQNQRLEAIANEALRTAEHALTCSEMRGASLALLVYSQAKREIEAMRPSASPWNAGFAAAQAGLDAIRPTISLRLVPEPHRSRIIADAVTHSTSEEAREAENVGSVCGKGAPFCQVVTPRGELRDESGRPISAEDEAKIRHECPRCPRRGGIVPPLEGEPSRAEGAGGARQTIADMTNSTIREAFANPHTAESPADIATANGELEAYHRALCLVRDMAPQVDGEAMRKAIFDAIQREAGGLPMSADECAEDPPIRCGTFKPLPPQEAALIRLRTERRELQNVRRCTGLSTSQTVRLGEVGAELDRLEAEADAWFKAPRDPGAP